MKNQLKKIIPVLIIFLYSFAFIKLSFYPHALRYGEEQSLINYDSVNWRYSSLWSGKLNFGNITPYYFATLTLGTFWRIASFFHLDLTATQHLFYFLLVFFVGFFFYLFVFALTKKRYLSVLLALIYITTYNFYSDMDTTPKLLQYLILPSFLWCWVKYMETSKFRYYIINIVFILLTLSIAINPPQIVGAYGMVMAFIILFYFNRKTWLKVLSFQIPYLFTLIFVAAVDLLAFTKNSHLFGFNPFSIPWSAPTSLISDIVRFFGIWADYSGSSDVRYYNHLFYYYHSPLGVIMTYIPFILLFILILTRSKTINSYRLSVLSLIVILILFTKGNAPPFNFVYNELTLVNYLKIFREPWAKFIIDLIFAIYVGIAILVAQKNNRLYRLAIIILTIYFAFQAYPMIRGRALDHRYTGWKAADVVIPSYWLDFASYSKNYLQNKRILVLPSSTTMGERLMYDWKPYRFVGYPEQFLVNADIIDSTGNDAGETQLLNQYFRQLSPSLLSLSSVDYVLYKNDSLLNNVKSVTIMPIKDALQLDKKKTFGRLELYPIKKEWAKAKIRSQQTAITFQKLNDTTYILNIAKISSPEINVDFAELYNSGWQLFKDNGLWTKPIPMVTHQNLGFFNTFIVPKEVIPANGNLYLRFSYQSIFETMRIFYILSLLLYLGITFNLIKPKKQ